MSSSEEVIRKARLFKNEGILIHIPKSMLINGVEKELFIGEKPFKQIDEVDDKVINFFVYYVDGVKIEFVTNFPDKGLILQVGYKHIHKDRKLLIYDEKGLNIQTFTTRQGTAHDIPGDFHGFHGSVIVELDDIPKDPNVGWGG